MIIFTTIRNIPQECIDVKGIREVVLFNLSSLHEGMPRLSLLAPSLQYISEDVLNGDCDTPEFDIEYHNSIITNDQAFCQFMSFMLIAYNSPDVLVQIMIARNNYRDAFLESLLKLIQQRYGYSAYIVDSIEDFLYTDEPSFSIPGLYNMANDRYRYLMLCGQLPTEEE